MTWYWKVIIATDLVVGVGFAISYGMWEARNDREKNIMSSTEDKWFLVFVMLLVWICWPLIGVGFAIKDFGPWIYKLMSKLEHKQAGIEMPKGGKNWWDKE